MITDPAQHEEQEHTADQAGEQPEHARAGTAQRTQDHHVHGQCREGMVGAEQERVASDHLGEVPGAQPPGDVGTEAHEQAEAQAQEQRGAQAEVPLVVEEQGSGSGRGAGRHGVPTKLSRHSDRDIVRSADHPFPSANSLPNVRAILPIGSLFRRSEPIQSVALH